MGFVASALQQLQRRAASREPQRLGAVRDVDLLLLLRETDNGELHLTQQCRGIPRRTELPFAAIDHHEIRE